MFLILKMYMQKKSPYKIARELNVSPPLVYKSLEQAEKNFVKADKMLNELKLLGWPEKVQEAHEQLQKRTAQKPEPDLKEIPLKFG